jgi:hypothetical protein
MPVKVFDADENLRTPLLLSDMREKGTSRVH